MKLVTNLKDVRLPRQPSDYENVTIIILTVRFVLFTLDDAYQYG